MWDLIVSVPDHCLSFYLAYHVMTLKIEDTTLPDVILCQTASCAI